MKPTHVLIEIEEWKNSLNRERLTGLPHRPDYKEIDLSPEAIAAAHKNDYGHWDSETYNKGFDDCFDNLLKSIL